MKYICLDCGHEWDRSSIIGSPQCPNVSNPPCRSHNVFPASFWNMVEEGRKLGIHPNTPFRDLIKAAQAVGAYESLIALGWQEFRRVMGRVVKEIEKTPIKRIAIEK